jgi:hypothetical protein
MHALGCEQGHVNLGDVVTWHGVMLSCCHLTWRHVVMLSPDMASGTCCAVLWCVSYIPGEKGGEREGENKRQRHSVRLTLSHHVADLTHRVTFVWPTCRA